MYSLFRDLAIIILSAKFFACVPLALQIRRALKSKRRCYKNGKVRNHADYQRRSR